MNKEHFLTVLKINLKQLSPKKREAVLKDYEDQLDSLVNEGLTEYEATKKLGNPKEITNAILAELNISTTDEPYEQDDWQELNHFDNDSSLENDNTSPSFFIRFCQIAGVILFNLLFMIWIIFAVLSVLFGGWLTVLVCLFSPIIGLITLALSGGLAGLFQLFLSIAVCGIGFIGLSLAIPITKYTLKFLYQYLVWTLNVLRGDY